MTGKEKEKTSARQLDIQKLITRKLLSYVITFLQHTAIVSYVDTKQHDCVKF